MADVVKRSTIMSNSILVNPNIFCTDPSYWLTHHKQITHIAIVSNSLTNHICVILHLKQILNILIKCVTFILFLVSSFALSSLQTFFTLYNSVIFVFNEKILQISHSLALFYTHKKVIKFFYFFKLKEKAWILTLIDSLP